MFTLVYGSPCDWVRNVMVSGVAQLEIGGDVIDLVDPQLLSDDDAFARLPAGAKRPLRDDEVHVALTAPVHRAETKTKHCVLSVSGMAFRCSQPPLRAPERGPIVGFRSSRATDAHTYITLAKEI